jgi:hypothetical protein
MILIWRGWGLVAVLTLFLPLASCVGFIDTRQGLAFLLAGLSLVAGGVGCWIFGRRWNHEVTEHTFFFIPLQYWGMIYVIFGVLMSGGGIAAIIRKGV